MPKVLLETAEQLQDRWEEQARYAREILAEIDAKGPFGDPPELRRLKGRIRRGEARDACHALGLSVEAHPLPRPAVLCAAADTGNFELTDRDIERVRGRTRTLQPHQIYITGHLADPNSVQGVCWRAFREAWEPWR